MKLKIVLAIFIASLIISAIPANAFAADPPKSKYNVGDKIVFGTGLVGTLQSIDSRLAKEYLSPR